MAIRSDVLAQARMNSCVRIVLFCLLVFGFLSLPLAACVSAPKRDPVQDPV